VVPEIILGGTVTQAGTTFCLVGQNLEARVNLADASNTIVFGWSAPSDSFKSFNVSPDKSHGSTTSLSQAELVNPSIRFAFKKDGVHSVSCDMQLVVDGEVLSLALSKNITVETLLYTSGQFASLASTYLGNYPGSKTGFEAGNLNDDDDWTNHGGTVCLGKNVDGVKFNANEMQLPPKYSNQGSGKVLFAQILGTDSIINYFSGLPGGFHHEFPSLDNNYPYHGSEFSVGYIGNSIASMDDTPSLSAGNGASSLSETGEYHAYLMLVPPDNGYGSQAVSVRKWKWNWNASASRPSIGSNLQPTYNPNGEPHILENSAHTDHPAWDQRAVNSGGSGAS
jgi:hypothetical protein